MKGTTITLNENELAFIDEQISIGKFENKSAVVSEALRVLEEHSKKDDENINEIELGYKAMSEDVEREAEANEWVENTLNPNEL